MSNKIEQLDEMLAFLAIRMDADGLDYDVVVLIEDFASALRDLRNAAVLEIIKNYRDDIPPLDMKEP